MGTNSNHMWSFLFSERQLNSPTSKTEKAHWWLSTGTGCVAFSLFHTWLWAFIIIWNRYRFLRNLFNLDLNTIDVCARNYLPCVVKTIPNFGWLMLHHSLNSIFKIFFYFQSWAFCQETTLSLLVLVLRGSLNGEATRPKEYKETVIFMNFSMWKHNFRGWVPQKWSGG